MTNTFFKKQKASNKENEKGPPYQEQLMALANKTYWTVLNTHHLIFKTNDEKLSDRANALKHALQTYGPSSKSLPDLRNNEGKAKGTIFHGHVNDANGTTYVLEWTIIDSKNRVMALTHFAKHENFKYKKDPLTSDEIKKILENTKNTIIMKRMPEKAKEAASKVKRVEENYKVAINGV